ncbi:TonB-dependent receptor [Flavobacterium crassostreae]|uniref:TonB-dependent receptor n=1 Tax=Flavobacterium crassostreae TaxID=1763534 RepID=A0A1B9E640_9FLAO|nr:TonB-dependent receptor [Flavobacterium crassostreae]OCB77393.1 hypothetical protein LPBF_05260 [Flavobacterium crassostreae]
MKLKLLILTLFISTLTFAQNKGTITGVLTDKDSNNETLPFANVLLKGTPINGTTDIDGKYTLNAPAGNYVIQFSFIGYESIETNITVKNGETLTLNKALGSSGYTLDDVVIISRSNKQKESALLMEQKNALTFKAAIGAEEISRKGASDVAAAVTKVSGVSKQEGSGNIFVRGLGDRYNITTLNGLPLPSNNPSHKNINLEIFSTDIVESVGISKTFESQNYADFSGANIDVVSKKFTGSPYIELGVGIGANSNVIKSDHFYLQDGPDYFGFRTVSAPNNPLLPYNYSTSWDRKESKNVLNANYSLSGGKKFNIGEQGSLSTFITASFGTDSKFTEGVDRGSVTAQGLANSDFYKKSYKYSTNTTVMGSFNYKINANNSILYTPLFLNSSGQEYSEYEGINQDFSGDLSGFIKRGTFDKTQLIINQLLGKNKINEQWSTNWGIGYSVLNNTIPDRMQNTLVPDAIGSNVYTFFTNSSVHNHRYFQDLEEKELAANVALSYEFKKTDDDYKGKITFGYSGKKKDVNFNANQYSFFPVNKKVASIHDIDTALNATNFDLTTSDNSSTIKQFYKGNLDIHAFYANLQYKLTDKLAVILGGRLEQLDQYVYFVTAEVADGGASKFSPTNFLPSVIAKYKVNDDQNIKFAFSKTYTLPQFKEKVNLLYQDVNLDFRGNPSLYASTDYNIDLGWENFLSTDELVSVTAFGKLIQNPINEMFENSGSGTVTYANTGDKAVAIGVEVELRKNILVIENAKDLKDKLSFGINGSYMYHNQDLDNDKVFKENGFGANFTYTESKLSGASDLLANADISFKKQFHQDRDISATLSYAYFSDKLAVIGTSDKGNMIDKSVNRLDFILKSSLTENLKIGLSYKNILDPTYKRVSEQSKAPRIKAEDLLISSYKIGSNLSLSLNYKF